MPQPRARRQRQLFEEAPAVPDARLPLDVQVQLRQVLAQWMQTLAQMLQKEGGDE
jgi:non-ribosomal peptide synthetase component F